MELDTLKDLYIDELKDLYSAEKQLVKALPKMAKAANAPQLKEAFRTHLAQTRTHAERLEQICRDLGVSPRGTLSLFRASQALALTEDRTYCIPDDIKRLVVPVFAHRIVVSSRFSSSLRRSEEAEAVLNEILKTVSVPL